MDTTASRNTAASMRAAAKWAYWIIGLVVMGAVSYFFYNSLNKQIAGVLFFLAGVVALYFYWVKWFVIPERRPAWPPYITPCPDYLTQVVPPATGGVPPTSYKCYDYVGVSRKTNGIARSDPSTTPSNDANKYMEITVADLKNPAKMQDLRGATMAKGVSWSTLFGND
jgi:hypothetical protein